MTKAKAEELGFECETRALLAAVRHAGSVISRTRIEILEAVHIDVGPGSLVITGTDLDRWASASTPATSGGEGKIVVTAQRLEIALSLLPSGSTVSCSMLGDVVTLACGRTKNTIPSFDPGGFPTAPDDAKSVNLSAPCERLSQSLSGLHGAAADNSDARPYLQGVFFDFAEKCLVSTNGHILGREPAEWLATDGPQPSNFILPASCIAPLKKMMDGSDVCNMSIIGDSQRISFECGSRKIATKVIDGTYPPYLRVIPTDFTHSTSISFEDFDAALSRVAAVAGYNGTVMQFDGAELILYGRGPVGDTAEDACAAKLELGGATKTAANGKYLRWASETLGGDNIELCISREGGPLVFRLPNDPPARLRLVTPMRFSP